jgi:protein-disulfide isomerase
MPERIAPLPSARRGLAPTARRLLGLLALGALSCSPPSSPGATGGESGGDASAGDPTPAARIGDDVITVGEVDAWIKDELFRRQTGDGDTAKLHEMRSDAIENMIHQRLLEQEAERQGKSTEALLQDEAAARAQVSDEDMRAFYERNKERVAAEFDEVAPQIRRHLERQAQGEAVGEYLAALRDERDVEVLLETPRLEVAATGPARGPEDAPVTIIEFSDYQCPYCRRVEPVVEQLLERYPEQVRLVYRHFPLESIHPEARAAAEAAVCAEEQGRFWELHEQLFTNEDMSAEALQGYAEQVGLDMDAFQACLEAPETKRRIETDLAAGREVGVTGTPAFFVNGIPLRGARPLADFVAVVEGELEDGGETASGPAEPAEG